MREEKGQHHLILYTFRATVPVFLYYPLPSNIQLGTRLCLYQVHSPTGKKKCGEAGVDTAVSAGPEFTSRFAQLFI